MSSAKSFEQHRLENLLLRAYQQISETTRSMRARGIPDPEISRALVAAVDRAFDRAEAEAREARDA